MNIKNFHFLWFVFVLGSIGLRAQALHSGLNTDGGACATPLVNDEELLKEAWANTRAYYPGIEESMRERSLKKIAGPPKLGDQHVFWVYNIQSRRFDTLRAELKAIGTFSYVWVSLAELQNFHVTSAEVNDILKALESATPAASRDSTKGILDHARQFFGDPPNIDSNFVKGQGDGKTHFLICDILDGWNGSGGYVAGFFLSVDVDPNSGASTSSNRRDLLYIDSYPGIYRNGGKIVTQALSTLAHEFQHLIHWNYDRSEMPFFNEGLSEYAEYLCGYGLRSSALYLAKTNVTLTSWSGSLADYSRAALWTIFLGEQYGDVFIKNFAQNPNSGTLGFETALAQSGINASISSTLLNWFMANWIGSSPLFPNYSYRSAPSGRASPKDEYFDPNVAKSFSLPAFAADYLAYLTGSNFKITFQLPSGMNVKAVESGPAGLRVRDVAGGLEFTSPGLGTQYHSLIFVVSNISTFSNQTYSFVSSGIVTRFVVEEKYDDGVPRPYSQGFAPYVGFGNSATAKGFAVRFHPAVKQNVLQKARLMVMFNQEFSNGTALPTDDKDFNFHVWGDDNGKPGRDLIAPFLVKVDRNRFPYDSYVDVDLSGYSSQLKNLPNPLYLGLTEDEDDSVGTYAAVHNLVSTDYSYVFRGPNSTTPNTWTTMRDVSARNDNKLDGFNFMFRAVFEYSDSSTAPTIVPGFLQHPVFTEYIKVIAAGSEELRLGSLTGTLSQSSGAKPLSFVAIPGTHKAFIDTTHVLKGSGTISIQVRGAKRYGVFYSDTLIAFTAKLTKRGESVTLRSVKGDLFLSAPEATFDNSTYVTAFDGLADPNIAFPVGKLPDKVFTVGPLGTELHGPAIIRVRNSQEDHEKTLAIFKDGRWLALPTLFDRSTSEYVSTLSTLGILGLLSKEKADGTMESVPTSYSLYQNYPNPFNPTTTIQYDLPMTTRVRLEVLDLLGREVAVLVDSERPAGRYRVVFSANNLSSGVYFYRLTAGGFSEVKKLVLLR